MFASRLLSSALIAGICLSVASPASAGGKVSLSLISATITKSFMPALVASYEKSHPDVEITVTYAGAKIASGVIERGGPDVAIITESFAQKISALDSPTEAFGMHTAIVVNKSSNKIKEAKDLAKPGVQLGGGSEGSQALKFQTETAQKLGQKYGPDFYKKYLANIAVTKSETPPLLPLIAAGELDGAIVVSAEVDKSKFTLIPLASSEAYSFYLDAASVKSSSHQNEAKALAAFLTGSEAKAAYRAAGYDTK